MKILLNSYCFVDSINYSGFTPLHLASQNGHAKVAKTLLKWKADPSLLNQVSVNLCVGGRDRERERERERERDRESVCVNVWSIQYACGKPTRK